MRLFPSAASHQVDCPRGPSLQPVLQQKRHVELRGAAVGDLLVRTGALPEDTPGRRRQARGEGLPDGGAGGVPKEHLRGHERGDGGDVY